LENGLKRVAEGVNAIRGAARHSLSIHGRVTPINPTVSGNIVKENPVESNISERLNLPAQQIATMVTNATTEPTIVRIVVHVPKYQACRDREKKIRAQ